MNEHPSHGRHCPFLNRADARCARHFSLEQLEHTFDHCFGEYEACGVYLELLYERRVRRAAARLQQHVIMADQGGDGEFDDACTNPDRERIEAQTGPGRAPGGGEVVVQLHIGRRRAAADAVGIGG